jgi:hypothetical protein
MAAVIAAGYEGQRKFEQAAERYRAAAEATSLPSEKASMRANEARALMAAGKAESARAIWAELVTIRSARWQTRRASGSES